MRIIAVLLMVLTGGLPILAADKNPVPSEQLLKHVGEKTFDILKKADRVEVFRITPDEEAKGDKKFGKYVITATGKEQNKDFAAKLAEVLNKDETYFGGSAKCFDPGVAFRIWSGKESIDLTICFKCSNFRIEEVWGKFAGGHGIRAQLTKVVKEAFPDDKEIQSLPDKTKSDDFFSKPKEPKK